MGLCIWRQEGFTGAGGFENYTTFFAARVTKGNGENEVRTGVFGQLNTRSKQLVYLRELHDKVVDFWFGLVWLDRVGLFLVCFWLVFGLVLIWFGWVFFCCFFNDSLSVIVLAVVSCVFCVVSVTY